MSTSSRRGDDRHQRLRAERADSPGSLFGESEQQAVAAALPDVAWVLVEGELDHGRVHDLETAMEAALTAGSRSPLELLVDARRVRFLDGGGIRALIGSIQLARRAGCRRVLLLGSVPVLRVCEVMQEHLGEVLMASREDDIPSDVAAKSCGLALFGPDRRYLAVNQRLASLNQRPVEDHLGRTPGEIVPGMDEQVGRYLDQVSTSLEPVGDVALTPPAARGEDWVAWFSPAYDHRALPVGIAAELVRRRESGPRRGLRSPSHRVAPSGGGPRSCSSHLVI